MQLAGASRALATDEAGIEVTGDALEWVSHPIRDNPPKTTLMVVVVAAAGAAVFWSTGSPFWAALSVAILLLGVHDFWLPTTYRLDAWGVTSRMIWFTRRKPWSALRSYYHGPHGVLVSPFPERTRLEAFRGLFIRYADNRDDVLARVRAELRPKMTRGQS